MSFIPVLCWLSWLGIPTYVQRGFCRTYHLFYTAVLSHLPSPPRAFTTASVPIASSADRLGHTSLHLLRRRSGTWPPQGIRELLGLMPIIQIQVQRPIYMKDFTLGSPCKSSPDTPSLRHKSALAGEGKQRPCSLEMATRRQGSLCRFSVAENFVLLNAVTFCITHGEF